MADNDGETNLKNSIKFLKNEIDKSKSSKEKIKELYNIENLPDINSRQLSELINNQISKTSLRVTFFIPVLQFLDIKSIVELSRVNHIFHFFIYSTFFYKSVHQIQIHQKKFANIQNTDVQIKKKESNTTTNSNSQDSDNNLFFGHTKKLYTNVMSALTGAFSYFGGDSSGDNKDKVRLEDIEKKINLHERLIDEKLKQIKISNEIKETRAEIDKYLNEQFELKKIQKKINEDFKNKNKIEDDKYEDEFNIQKIKRDKYESEYKTLLKEIGNYEEKYKKLEKDNEKQYQIGIDLETKINKIRHYVKNNNFK